MVNGKKLDNAQKLRGICFADDEDKEFKETIKKKIGNTNGSSHVLKDRQEKHRFFAQIGWLLLLNCGEEA